MAAVGTRTGSTGGAEAGYTQFHKAISQVRRLARGEDQPGIGKAQPEGRYHLDQVSISGQMCKLLRPNPFRGAHAGKGY